MDSMAPRQLLVLCYQTQADIVVFYKSRLYKFGSQNMYMSARGFGTRVYVKTYLWDYKVLRFLLLHCYDGIYCGSLYFSLWIHHGNIH